MENNHFKLVSIIIPCYNGEDFITETISSVLKQSYQNFELIIVNDGSTDRSEECIKKLSDPRITYLKKKNTGVSDSRNKGFEICKGDYVLYLDCDDLLAPDFIEKRVAFLMQHPQFGFCASAVIKIDEKGKEMPSDKLRGVSTNILEDILSYNSEVITCPSNYLLRKELLADAQILFDPDLSSSADRYFLVELANYTTGGMITDGGLLYYRVHTASMSHHLTINLVKDNLLFQKKILRLNIAPRKLRQDFYFKSNYIFAGSYYKLKKFSHCIWYALNSFYYSPVKFVKQLSK